MRRVAAFGLSALFAAAPLSTQAQAPGAPPAATPAPDPALDAAKGAFEALPEADRKAIQEALVWTGDFNGVTSGSFGKRTYDAIVAYQKRAKINANGVLDDKARAGLQAAAQRARDGVGFAAVRDERTGLQVGLPRKLLTKTEAAPGQGGGTRWQSADDKVTLDTRAWKPGEQDLPALFERLVNQPTPGRQVTYKFLRPDILVVSGETPTGKFYIRYAAGPAGVRGFTLGYDKSVKDFDKLVIAVANSFAAFPETIPATPVATAAPTPPGRPPETRIGLFATGLALAPRRVVTSAAVESCPDLRVNKAKARVLRADAASGLALLETEAAVTGTAPRLGEGGSDVVVLSQATLAGTTSLVATPGSLDGTRIAAPLQPGGAGAPIFDRSGNLVGLVGTLAPEPRLIAGIVPPMTHPARMAEAIKGFLSANGVAAQPAGAGANRTAGEIVAETGARVVAIECAR
ncbi:MAG TPA: serine protease [Beijerinckiaceae bacterium]|jgi:peptidoglycan hydrolase-like protein with peptidoglycan-binding domain